VKYATPQALRSALAAHARRAAGEAGVSSADLILRFYLGRLLARVFRADPDGWLLKGGQALLVRYPDARHSRDIDLCGTSTTSLDAAVAALERAVQLDLDDHLRFILRSRDDRLEGHGSTRLKFDVQLGGRVIPNGISVDVVVDRYPLGQPTRKQLESPVPLDWPAGYPVIALYPVIDHVADKVCAMYEKHGTDGIASTRYRDLVDLVLIALREPLDGPQLRLAVHTEVARRTARGTPIQLPATFTIPGSAWPAGYRAAAATVAGLVDYRTIESAAELAHTLLDPLLAEGAAPAQWDPHHRRW
jgi:hypothetical protein